MGSSEEYSGMFHTKPCKA